MALGLFQDEGFDQVTLDGLAAAAGVSRSTFLRYFGTKEDVVLSAFDPLGDLMTDALRARPASESTLTALRRALDPVTVHFATRPAEQLALLRLVQGTPALCARLREKHVGWHPRLLAVLTERSPDTSTVVCQVRVAAALDCLTVALEHWVAAECTVPLADLLDEGFGAFG